MSRHEIPVESRGLGAVPTGFRRRRLVKPIAPRHNEVRQARLDSGGQALPLQELSGEQ